MLLIALEDQLTGIIDWAIAEEKVVVGLAVNGIPPNDAPPEPFDLRGDGALLVTVGRSAVPTISSSV